ncbi:MAG: aldo/keto reductase [Pseudomonadales bacterium]
MNISKYPLSKHIRNNSPIIYGCMGLGGDWNKIDITSEAIKQAHEALDTAIESGITLIDHADIYSRGKAEKVFGEVLKQRPGLRDQIAIQSKCGIRFADEKGPKRYDCSPEWILHSVDNILTRLHIEQLDLLMLHRPDPLIEPELVAEAFNELEAAGKVKNFGVSNMHQHHMAFLQSSMSQPIVVNQIELSLSHQPWLEECVTSGNSGHPAVNFGSGTIEHCRQNNIQIQAWGSLCQGLFSGRDVSTEAVHIQKTAELVAQLAAEYQTSKEAIVVNWLMSHPANIQPVIGTTNIERIKACAQASDIKVSREHLYALWVSARGRELP